MATLIRLLLICYFWVGGLAMVDALNLNQQQQNHLVVLSHGIMGGTKDLEYLAERLTRGGCVVLVSKVNALTNSLLGIEHGAKGLVREIEDVLRDSLIDKISFVGNSLGGLYARAAIAILGRTKPGSLKFNKFMSIASPHLGVADFNYLNQEFAFPFPLFLKQAVASTMGTTGRELFLLDDEQLLLKMATEEDYLAPLRQFAARRAYANLRNDFVVPLGTAAMLSPGTVCKLRADHTAQSGVVATINQNAQHPQEQQQQQDGSGEASQRMLNSLNNLGWEKIVVHFPGILPISHNKIAALRKWPEWFFVGVMKTSEGEFLMDEAANWLTGRDAEET